MKPTTIKIADKEVKIAIKGQRRNEMIENGVYSLHKNRTFKDKSKYNRKDQPKNWD